MTDSLPHRLLAGDPRALARAITLIEDDDSAGAAIVRELFARTGRACLIAVTGSSGARTSALVDRLARAVRETGRTVAVITVDSADQADQVDPVDAIETGNPAEAGVPDARDAQREDRARPPARVDDDPGLFRHRVASRGGRGDRGGLVRAIGDVALLLDAAGRDVVLIDATGAGPDAMEIIRTADIALVTLTPRPGDRMPAPASGSMAFGDIFIDIADDADTADTGDTADDAARVRAGRAAAVIESALSQQATDADAWRPPVLRVETATGKGLSELLAAIDEFRAHSAAVQEARRRARAAHRLRELLVTRLLDDVERRVLGPGGIDRYAGQIAGRAIDPYAAADEILARSRAPQAPAPDAGVAAAPSVSAPVAATLDHVGIAVADLGAALAFYRDAIGLVVDEPEEVPSQRVRAHFIPAGGEAAIELLEATAPDSPIAKFVDKRGPGLHHITLRVDDIRAALAALKARGARLIDQEPRPGAHGSLVAFVHPAAAHGVLVELKETGKA